MDKTVTGQFSVGQSGNMTDFYPNTSTFLCHCHPTDGTHSYFVHLPPTRCNIFLAADSVMKQNKKGSSYSAEYKQLVDARLRKTAVVSTFGMRAFKILKRESIGGEASKE